jgi:kanamycin kinase
VSDAWAGPPADTPTPDAVLALAAGRPLEAVWLNQLGGLTYFVGADQVVKWSPTSAGIDLGAEAARLAWASPFLRVPRVLDAGADETGTWLLTERLPGENAVTERWRADPATALRAVGEGLRAMHDRLPVETCPFEWSAGSRLAAKGAHATGSSLDALREPPPIDLLVVCHGDACAPNTLVADDGRWAGHVDLGRLGVGDRWADLAVATWSTQWNYGDGWEQPLLDAYGIDPDPVRTEYYRALWDAEPSRPV